MLSTAGLIFVGVLFGMLITSLISINHIRSSEEEVINAQQYLTTLLRTIAPKTIPADDLVTLCTQVDNYIVRMNPFGFDDIKRKG